MKSFKKHWVYVVLGASLFLNLLLLWNSNIKDINVENRNVTTAQESCYEKADKVRKLNDPAIYNSLLENLSKKGYGEGEIRKALLERIQEENQTFDEYYKDCLLEQNL